jgi:hypothetical protein
MSIACDAGLFGRTAALVAGAARPEPSETPKKYRVSAHPGLRRAACSARRGRQKHLRTAWRDRNFIAVAGAPMPRGGPNPRVDSTNPHD